MSLLMEALRKVEQERTGSPETPEPAAPRTEEDSLLVLDLPEEVEEIAKDSPESPSAEEGVPSGFALEAPVEEAFRTPVEAQHAGEGHAASDGDASGPGEEPVREEEPAPVAGPAGSALPAEEGGAGESLRLQPSRLDARETGESREEEDSGAEMAQALMRLKAGARRNRLLLGLLALLAFLAVAGMGAWYYLETGLLNGSPIPSAVPPAPVGGGEPEEAASPPERSVPEQVTAEAPQAQRDAGAPAVPVEGTRAQTAPVSPPAPAAPAGERTGGAGAPAAARPAPFPEEKAPVTARAAYRQALSRMAGGAEHSGSIEIRRSTRRPAAEGRLRQAWEAYRAGRYREADRLWAAVLAERPLNRDALLGRAAVAVAEGRQEAAQEYYLRLLERNPRDPLALAGMASLRGRQQPVEAIARIRALIAEHPELDGLQFVLGNLYAAQSRWSYAQQAYFKAHAGDPQNPDYLFNLAVSLDHLGKAEQALQFYRKALEQARQRRAAFSADQARRRIAALEGRLEAG